MRIYWDENALFFWKNIIRILFFMLVWLTGSIMTIVLLNNKKVAPDKKYSMISLIGLLFLAILVIRLLNNKGQVLHINNNSTQSWFRFTSPSPLKHDYYFKDYDSRVVNLKNVLKKRQICLFSIADSNTLRTELEKIAESDLIDYYFIDLDYAFDRYYSQKNLIKFWEQFSLSLITTIASNAYSKKTMVFSWTLKRNVRRSEMRTLEDQEKIMSEDTDKERIEHFFEVLETLTGRLRNFNILIVTETPELLYWLKGSQLSRIVSVFKLTAHKAKKSKAQLSYRNTKLSELEQEQQTNLGQLHEDEVRAEKLEQERHKKWLEYAQIGDKDERKKKILEDQRKERTKVLEEEFERDRKIQQYKVSLSDQKNREVLRSVLKSSKSIGKNEWVMINQIPNFHLIEDRFNYLVDLKVLDRSGDVVRFRNDDVHHYYSDRLNEIVKGAGMKVGEVKRKRKANWIVRFLWDHAFED